jgi:hypothetical protein
MFDADKFMQTNITGPSSTTVLICPEGEFKAVVDDGDKAITARSFPGKDGKSDSHQMQVLFSILDDAAKAAVKRDKCSRAHDRLARCGRQRQPGYL